MRRDLEKAREAFRRRDHEASKRAHLHAPEEHRSQQGQYIKSIVYGGLDGIITTFAVVAGVAGASLSTGVALILGFANLIADGLSMAIGDFLSTRAENEYKAAERERERWEVDHFPEGEKLEMIDLYRSKGIPQEDAEAMVEILARHPEAWVDVMMVEELGLTQDEESPLKNAVATFCSFAAFGLVPLLAFIIAPAFPALQQYLFFSASLITAGTLFLLGTLKAYVTGRKWFTSGVETLLVGGLAASAAYLIGRLLAGLA